MTAVYGTRPVPPLIDSFVSHLTPLLVAENALEKHNLNL